MGKFTDRGLMKADDPMFSEGATVFSPTRFKESMSDTAKTADGATPAKSLTSKPPLNSQGRKKLPDPPKREKYSSDDAFLEARGRWQETVGRIRGLAAQGRRPLSKSKDGNE